jgi:hypothetical protein
MDREHILNSIETELELAYDKHGNDLWGRHEFYGILLEEIEELWDAIKADEPMVNVRKEALQAACVIVRYLESGDRYGFE